MIADSSVWIEFFRGAPTRQVDCLNDAIAEGEVIVGDLILCEVLQGFRPEKHFEYARRVLSRFDIIPIADSSVAVHAARNYRALRAKGITIRKTIDVLIATRCILDDLPLLYSDRDFDPFVTHFGLRSVLDPNAGVQ